jgi:hypothetical protein
MGHTLFLLKMVACVSMAKRSLCRKKIYWRGRGGAAVETPPHERALRSEELNRKCFPNGTSPAMTTSGKDTARMTMSVGNGAATDGGWWLSRPEWQPALGERATRGDFLGSNYY